MENVPRKHPIQPDIKNIISSFKGLKNWIEDTLDIFREELLSILYPLFIHTYLDLVATKNEMAFFYFKEFRNTFTNITKKNVQELEMIQAITDPVHLRENNLANTFRSNKYSLEMSKHTFDLLIGYLEDNELTYFLKIISHYFDIQVYSGFKKPSSVQGLFGGMNYDVKLDLTTWLVSKECEEAILNNEKYKYDTIEQFIQQLKKTNITKKPTSQFLSPSIINSEIEKVKDLCKRVNLAKNCLPSICCYTIHNGDEVTCAEISDDCRYIAVGYSDSTIEIHGLDGELKKLKNSNELGKADIDKKIKTKKLENQEKILNEIEKRKEEFINQMKNENKSPENAFIDDDLKKDMDEDFELKDLEGKLLNKSNSMEKDELFQSNSKNQDEIDKMNNDQKPINDEVVKQKQKDYDKIKNDSSDSIFKNIGHTAKLIGHAGPIYSLKFFKGNKSLMSVSQDCTVRLWSLELFTCIAVYKAHVFPIWTIDISPNNFYFVSGGSDRQAILWSIISTKPERLFVSAFSDVTTVKFHPNGNYIFIGSSDTKIRMHDIQDGRLLRVFHGHLDGVSCIEASSCGKYILSGGRDNLVILWNIETGKIICQYTGHENAIYSVSFCWFGSIVSSCGADNTVRLWDIGDTKGTCLGVFNTRNTPLLCVKFGYRNIISTIGPFRG